MLRLYDPFYYYFVTHNIVTSSTGTNLPFGSTYIATLNAIHAQGLNIWQLHSGSGKISGISYLIYV